MKDLLHSTLLSVFLLGLYGQADAQGLSPFRLRASGVTTTQLVNQTFTAYDTISDFGTTLPVNGLSVTMKVIPHSQDFIVRILLEDTDGKSYLVVEAYNELAEDADTLIYSQYCEETGNLSNILPQRLKIYVSNAEVAISKIELSTVPRSLHGIKSVTGLFNEADSIAKMQQLQAKVDKINAYNIAHNKLWRAVVPSCALSHEALMKRIGCPEGAVSGGLEFYAGGIFEFGQKQDDGSAKSPRRHTVATEPYTNDLIPVSEFDWRNRHGRNWITPVKNQRETASCTAYASVGALESDAQLYYNRQSFHNGEIDTLDLAEGDVYNGFPDLNITGIDHTWRVVSYFASHGVNDEGSNPYDGGMKLTPRNQPLVNVSPQGYSSCEDTYGAVKRTLMAKGPLVSGYEYDAVWNPDSGKYDRGGHAMVLVGFGKIHEGQELMYYVSNQIIVRDTIPAGHPLIGQDYFIFKNSYGESPDSRPYMYITFKDVTTYYNNYMIGPYYFEFPIHITEYDEESQDITKIYSESDVVCEDRDGDGFHFWGLGPKPAHCPADAFPEPDGDDSDPFIGPIDENGCYRNLDPCTNDTMWVDDAIHAGEWGEVIHCYNHVKLYDGDDSFPFGPIFFHNGSRIYISRGSTFRAEDRFTLYNAEIIMEPGSRLVIDGGSRVILRRGTSFNPPQGAIVEIRRGSIEPFSNTFPG